jgi:hypothetical protein
MNRRTNLTRAERLTLTCAALNGILSGVARAALIWLLNHLYA